jgi:hypothetical protein
MYARGRGGGEELELRSAPVLPAMEVGQDLDLFLLVATIHRRSRHPVFHDAETMLRSTPDLHGFSCYILEMLHLDRVEASFFT